MADGQRSQGGRGARIPATTAWVLAAISLVMLSLAGWIRWRFGVVYFQQVLLNLPFVTGTSVGSPALAVEALLVCLVVPIAVVVAIRIAVRLWIARHPRKLPGAKIGLLLSTGAIVVSAAILTSALGLPSYLSMVGERRSVAPYYVPPGLVSSPNKPKNLVVIYAESLENGFADPARFGQNLIAPLDAATPSWTRFDHLSQFPGGGWTMAGIIGTQCGVPYKARDLGSTAPPGANPRYLSGLTCLGDVLSEQGYTNTFLGGADPTFAAKKDFLTAHGYGQVKGLSDWLNEGVDPREVGSWGISDHELFRRAERTIAELRAAGRPFNLTMLTLDTHDPASVYPSCPARTSQTESSAMLCSMEAIAGFLDFLAKGGYLDDTVVVVTGDQLKEIGEGTGFGSQLRYVTDRTILFRATGPEPFRFYRQNADQLSVFATTLEMLEFKLRDGRAGLGVSFAGPHSLSGTALALPPPEYEALLLAPSSALYRMFWGR